MAKTHFFANLHFREKTKTICEKIQLIKHLNTNKEYKNKFQKPFSRAILIYTFAKNPGKEAKFI